MMTKAAIAALALITGTTSLAAPASAASCFDLWFQRNAIYDNYGYCFKTALGQQTFGTNCSTNNPRLSARDQNQVAAIKAEERRRNCKVNQ
jgi:YARHG domain